MCNDRHVVIYTKYIGRRIVYLVLKKHSHLPDWLENLLFCAALTLLVPSFPLSGRYDIMVTAKGCIPLNDFFIDFDQPQIVEVL